MSLQQPLVSIIIPVFNRDFILHETLESVLLQDYESWECIVVDDMSTDNSKNVIDHYCGLDKRFVYMKNVRSKGAQGARNTGLQHAKGSYLVFLDSDDILTVKCLFQRVETLKNNPGFDFYCFPTAIFHKVPFDSEYVWNYLNKEKSDIERFFDQDMGWQTCGVLWTASMLNTLKGWDESLVCWQDWDIHVRALLAKGSKYCKVKDELKNIDNFYRADLSIDSIAKARETKEYIQCKTRLITKLAIPERLLKHASVRLSFARLCFRVAIEAASVFEYKIAREFFTANLRKVKYSSGFIFFWSEYLYNVCFPKRNKGLRRSFNIIPRLYTSKHLLKNENTHLKVSLDYGQ